MIELFALSTHKLNWGEIYYGLKKGFIDAQFIINNYNNDRILFYTENRYIELLLSIQDSLFEVLKKIKKYIYEDDFIDIQHSDNEIIEVVDFVFIPKKYKVFWDELYEFSILKNIVNLKDPGVEKYYKLYLHHSNVNYKEDWREFINFYFNGNPNVKVEDLDKKFLKYFNTLKNKLNLL